MPGTRRRLLFVLAVLVLAAPVANSQTALQFVPMTPCRLFDTRNGSPLMSNQTITVQVQGVCGIPAAQAYSFNVTVVPHVPLNYLTLWPTGQQQPLVSTMNSYDGRVKAVAAIIPAGTGGAINAYATNTTDLILDINGYFVSSIDSTLAFYPLTPCRLYDTRGGNYLHAQQTVNFSIPGICDIPTNAQAYVFNLTALPLHGSLNYLTAWPAGQPQPATSTLNAPTGAVTANAAIVQGGTSGAISVFAYDDTNLIIDVNGYFAPPGAPGQLALYTLTPCRVLDTRPNYFQGAMTVQVENSACNVSGAAQAYIVNAAVIPQHTLGYLTLWGTGQRPLASTLNAYDGAVTSNLAIVPADAANGTFQAYASDSTQLLIDIFSYMGLAPLTIETTSLPEGVVNHSYQAQLMGSGGAPPYTWTRTGGSLPPGLMLSSSGVVSGTPTSTGLFTFTVKLTDSQNNHVSGQVSLGVGTGTLAIATTQLPNGTQGVGYSATLTGSGGLQPYNWTVASGSLPPGLTLNASSGVISGTPTANGVYSFTIQLTDANQYSVTAPFQILVNAVIGNSLLNGNYALAFTGYSNGTPFVMAAAFIADGQGSITGGKLDRNDGHGSEFNDPSQCRDNPNCPVAETIQAGSSYDLSASSGLGTMTLATIDHAGNPHTYQFSIVVSGNGCIANASSSFCGQLIQRDPANPATYGSGVLKVQDSAYFSIDGFFTPHAGANVAVLVNGFDPSGQRYAAAGALATNPTTQVDIDCNGNGWGFTNGCPLDLNDNGQAASDSMKGSFSADLDPTTGRGNFVNIKYPGDPHGVCPSGTGCSYAYYIVNHQEMLLISGDLQSRPANLTLWLAVRQSQSAGWTLGALNGTSVMQLSALDPNGGKADVTAGLLTADGNGNASLSSDENDGGTLAQHSSQGTYSLGSTGQKSGRVALSGFGGQFSSPPILYLVDANRAFIVDTDAKVNSGVLQPQSGAPFSNTSVGGFYAGGTIFPVLSAVTNSVTSLFADGGGHITATQYTSGPGGPGGPNNSTLNYQVDSTGRAVVQNQNGQEFGVLYVVGPSTFVLVPSGNAPASNTFNSGSH